MKIYVSGPMTGFKDFNFPAFDEVSEQLRDAGNEVFSPADHDREQVARLWPGKVPSDFPGYAEGDITGYFDEVSSGGEFTLDNMLKADLDFIVNEAEAMICLPGWEKSTGARYERNVAEALNVPIYLAHVLGGDGESGGYALTLDDDQKRLTAFSRSFATPADAAPTGEVRVINETTGGAKGQKLARFDLLPASPLWAVAEHYGKGASKYAERNWERGYDWSLTFGAMMRHAWAFWNGEDIDPETGSHHMAAVVFHAFALMEFATTHPELDDRPKEIQ